MRRNDALSLRKSDSDISLRSKVDPMLFSAAKKPIGNFVRSLWNESSNQYPYQLHRENRSCFTKHSSSNGDGRQIVQTAGMRVFATVLLNAWRKRKQDVKDLTVRVMELKRASIKTKNQIHVFNTLFRVEQKRNRELTCQLKHSIEDINQAKSCCENLTTTIISLKADRALLEEQLRMKLKELEGLNEHLSQIKTDLYRSLMEQRNLQHVLVKEQRNVQYLENHKNKLINEITDLGTENHQRQDKYSKELTKKEQELKKAMDEITKLEQYLIDKKENAFKALEYADTDARWNTELSALRQRVLALRNDLNKSIINRLKFYWQQWCSYQKATVRMGHWLAFYLLPATPPPKFTFTSMIF